MGSDLPGMGSDLPGTGSDLPGTGSDAPGATSGAPARGQSGPRRPVRLRLSLLALALLGAIALSLGVGAVAIAPGEVAAILADRLGVGLPWAFDDRQATTLLAIRLPRVVTTALVGAAWACAGLALQALHRTPLADPALIGIGGAAALGSTLGLAAAISVGIAGQAAGAAMVAAGALGIGLAAAAVVHRVATASGRSVVGTLLLAGMALTALFAALTALVVTASREPDLGSVAFWSLGSMGGVDGRDVALAAAVTLPAIWLLARLAPGLDALALGEREAGHLGIDVRRLTLAVGITLTVLTAVAVSIAGVIAFVGLMVPTLARAWIGVGHRVATIGAAILGALALVLADIVARSLFGPVDMPVGVITTLVGAPFFLGLILRDRWLLAR